MRIREFQRPVAWAAMTFAVAALLAVPAPAGAPPAKHPMLGEAAPAFRLRDLAGRSLSLGDLRGKLVVLHFGASW